jgi:uncharacterized caspase-like protein
MRKVCGMWRGRPTRCVTGRTLLAAALAAIVVVHTSALSAASDPRRVMPPSAPRVALVIGNAGYLKLGALDNPAKDARLIADRLRQFGFEVIEKNDRDLKGMTDDVEDFARRIRERGPQTVSVLYYAGHGLENDSINYLVPVDADIKRRADIAAKSLSVKRIADRLSAAGNQLNILILDACRNNPFPESVAPQGIVGLVPMGAVFGVFIASATASGKTAFDGDDGHSPYARALADAMTMPGEKLEDVFKSVRRQVRLTTGEQQIPWESTSLERDFYFVPPTPPPSPASQLLAAANETGNVALFDLLIERFPDSAEAAAARGAAARLRQFEVDHPSAAATSAASLVLGRAKQAQTPQAYDFVASLFPGTPEAEEARATAARLREMTVLDSAGPTYEGRELVQAIQEQLFRLDCLSGERSGVFEGPTIQALRRASLLTDEHYLWYRPTMAALRAVRKIGTAEGCRGQKLVAAPRCLRVNNEDFCQ